MVAVAVVVLGCGLLAPRPGLAAPPSVGDAEPAVAEDTEPEPIEDTEPVEDAQPEPTTDEPEPDEADLEGEEALDAEGPDVDDGDGSLDVPTKLPKLQRIAWVHVLGAFALGTTAGVLVGLAEREEDRAFRLVASYNLESSTAPLYADHQTRYERILDRGQGFQTSAIVVGALAGASAVAAITLFAVDARRRKPSSTARRTTVGPGSLRVTF